MAKQLVMLTRSQVLGSNPSRGRLHFITIHPSLHKALCSGFIHVREMSGKFNFFQGQGIVREFCDVSGKNIILQKCQGNVREFCISA